MFYTVKIRAAFFHAFHSNHHQNSSQFFTSTLFFVHKLKSFSLLSSIIVYIEALKQDVDTRAFYLVAYCREGLMKQSPKCIMKAVAVV